MVDERESLIQHYGITLLEPIRNQTTLMASMSHQELSRLANQGGYDTSSTAGGDH